jgi:hypothetical protein
VAELRRIAERYLSVLIVVILALLYEQLTPSHETATGDAVEWGKIVLWLLLGPTLPLFVIYVAFGYQGLARKLESGLRTLAEALARNRNNADLLAKVMAARAELMWKQSPTEFVLTVVKSANIAMPLLVAVSGYVLHTLSGGEWIDVFVPREVVSLFHRFYR